MKGYWDPFNPKNPIDPLKEPLRIPLNRYTRFEGWILGGWISGV